jgi:hypothetical protein
MTPKQMNDTVPFRSQLGGVESGYRLICMAINSTSAHVRQSGAGTKPIEGSTAFALARGYFMRFRSMRCFRCCHRPKGPDRTGRDDYLVAGHTTQELWWLVKPAIPPLTNWSHGGQEGADKDSSNAVPAPMPYGSIDGAAVLENGEEDAPNAQ